jgi:alginate O-acetyltransferase complex protein AlgI
MVFNSLGFLIFFAVVLGIHQLPLSWRAKKVNLVVASSLFYAAWNPLFLLLLWISITVDWQIATRMNRFRPEIRKRMLLVSLVVNLGALSLFKYGDFLAQNAAWLLARLGMHYQPSPLGIALPVGISFYTFETLSYTIDVYRGDERPWKSFLDFAVFLTFFPHLVAGPIVRPLDFLPQCEHPRQATGRQLGWGLTLLVIGLFEKTVVADGTLAPIVDRVFHASAGVSAADAWCGALAFAGQIFCDFAGYSLCAIGVALCFGFLLPDNFNCPYAAIGFSDFWQRWHISLSSWLRDYLYVSLGGNRTGRGRTYLNLALTMLLGGLWHGASWTYVAWGGLHGTYLIGERLIRGPARREAPTGGGASAFAGVALTFLLTTIAWVFFRSTSFQQAFSLILAMAGSRAPAVSRIVGRRELVEVLGIMAAMLALQWWGRDRSLAAVVSKVPWPIRTVVLAAMTILIITDDSPDRAFIYFQF